MKVEASDIVEPTHPYQGLQVGPQIRFISLCGLSGHLPPGSSITGHCQIYQVLARRHLAWALTSNHCDIDPSSKIVEIASSAWL